MERVVGNNKRKIMMIERLVIKNTDLYEECINLRSELEIHE
ncbi:hypothetical protein BTJ45_00105 [Bacillus mycoides]|nr:hypothetical protein BTJ45_00105 [Bacillus mycoides]